MKHTIELIDTKTRESVWHVIETETADELLLAAEGLRDKLGEKSGTTYLITDITRGDTRG